MKFINLTLFISQFGVHGRENIIFMGIFFDHSKQTEVSYYKLQQMYESRRGVSNYSKCTRSASMSNSDSKCMRFSYLLELYGLSACGPTLEIFERFRILHPDLTIKKQFFDLRFGRIRYCIPNLPRGSFEKLTRKQSFGSDQ